MPLGGYAMDSLCGNDGSGRLTLRQAQGERRGWIPAFAGMTGVG